MDPLPEVSGKQEVGDTADHILKAFYPVSPSIDLQKVHLYEEEVNCSGESSSCVGVLCLCVPEAERSVSLFSLLRFQEGLPLPSCPHTLLPGGWRR